MQKVNPFDEARMRTYKVLVQIFGGDMISALGALAAIYPRVWHRDILTPDEFKEYKVVAEQDAVKYLESLSFVGSFHMIILLSILEYEKSPLPMKAEGSISGWI